MIAGSVGAYGACQHDWSEYTGKYVDKMSTQVPVNTMTENSKQLK